jgi:hypothetical protein
MDDAEKKRSLIELFNRVMIYIPQIIKRTVGQNDIATLFELDPNTFSRYAGGRGLPGIDNVFKLGNSLHKYNPAWSHEYYNILEIPEPINLNDQQKLLIDNWDYLSEDDIVEIMRVYKNAKGKKGRRTATSTDLVENEKPDE